MLFVYFFFKHPAPHAAVCIFPSLPPRPGSGCCVKQAIAQDRDRCQTERQEAAEEGGKLLREIIELCWALFCGRGAGRGKAGRRTFAVVEPWWGFKRWTRGRDPPGIGSDDRPDTAWLSRRLHSAIVQAHTSTHSSTQLCKQHTQAALWLHFLYATGTHRVHWPTYSRGPSDGMPGLRVALDEHWRAP